MSLSTISTFNLHNDGITHDDVPSNYVGKWGYGNCERETGGNEETRSSLATLIGITNPVDEL